MSVNHAENHCLQILLIHSLKFMCVQNMHSKCTDIHLITKNLLNCAAKQYQRVDWKR